MQINVKHGLDLRVGGHPRQNIEPGPVVRHVALLGEDYGGLKPSLQVEVGDRVLAGQTLFHDRHYPEIRYTSSVAGTVTAIIRGPKRRVVSVVVGRDGDDAVVFRKYTPDALARAPEDEIAEQLLQSGQWTALRSRPYERVPGPDQRPEWLFITAIDTDPLAPDPKVVLRQYRDAFNTGLIALTRLARRRVYLCTGVDAELPLPELPSGLTVAQFAGPHPAGLPGTHIHHLARVSADAAAWHVSYQDVIAIGQQFLTGKPWLQRVVALGGPGMRDPRLITTPIGASVTELLAGERLEGYRVVSGSVLGGRALEAGGEFLGRYHRQIALLQDNEAAVPAGRKPRSLPMARTVRGRIRDRIAAALSVRPTGLLPVEAFDRVWPLRIAPVPLLRALLVNDTENAEALGCLALAEEDLALCSYVCPANLDYSSALRATLESIERET